MDAAGLQTPIDPRSKAWCADCSWKAWGSRCHVGANAHSGQKQHLVHLWEPDPEPAPPCGETFIGGLAAAFSCSRDPGHPGEHRSTGGTEWENPQVDNAVDNPNKR